MRVGRPENGDGGGTIVGTRAPERRVEPVHVATGAREERGYPEFVPVAGKGGKVASSLCGVLFCGEGIIGRATLSFFGGIKNNN